jgi:hypothetical protein
MNPDYGNGSEAWAIRFIEFPTATEVGEVTQVRKNHDEGTFVTTPSVIENGYDK